MTVYVLLAKLQKTELEIKLIVVMVKDMISVRVIPTMPLNHQLYMMQTDPELKSQMIPCQKLEMKITGEFTKIGHDGTIESKLFGYIRFKK